MIQIERALSAYDYEVRFGPPGRAEGNIPEQSRNYSAALSISEWVASTLVSSFVQYYNLIHLRILFSFVALSNTPPDRKDTRHSSFFKRHSYSIFV